MMDIKDSTSRSAEMKAPSYHNYSNASTTSSEGLGPTISTTLFDHEPLVPRYPICDRRSPDWYQGNKLRLGGGMYVVCHPN